MKKSQLKELIKECVREVVFEEGALTKIVAEVAQGFTQAAPIVEQAPARQVDPKIRERIMREVGPKPTRQPTEAETSLREMPFFTNTEPLTENNNPAGEAGLDISNIPGMSQWGNVLSKIEKGR
tara:strand:- start:194 stop:565 length:372 start_codon:yes stop_codon:yes gene_type:complete